MGKEGRSAFAIFWVETVVALRKIPLDANSDAQVFQNTHGAPLTRDGAAYVVEKYVKRAARTRPSLLHGRVTPHVLRHSCAVALLQAGVDICVIRDYLGHASVATTSRYTTTPPRVSTNVATRPLRPRLGPLRPA